MDTADFSEVQNSYRPKINMNTKSAALLPKTIQEPDAEFDPVDHMLSASEQKLNNYAS